jgi:hypothetical protein
MPDCTHVRRFDGAAALMRLVVLAASLAAILAASYSLVSNGPALPSQPTWAIWRLPILEVVAIVLILMLFWAYRRPSRSWAVDAIVAALGLASSIIGLAGAFLVASAVSLKTSGFALSRAAQFRRITEPAVLDGALKFAALTALPAIIGFWIARRRVRTTGRVSMAGAALRFATAGIALAVLLAGATAAAVICRRLIWS